jgi:hypothetical protein
MLVLRRQDDKVPRVHLPKEIDTEGGPRTARNMLTPSGIPRKGWFHDEWEPRDDYPDLVMEAAAPCALVGTSTDRKLPIFSPDGNLADYIGFLIAIDRGV